MASQYQQGYNRGNFQSYYQKTSWCIIFSCVKKSSLFQIWVRSAQVNQEDKTKHLLLFLPSPVVSAGSYIHSRQELEVQSSLQPFHYKVFNVNISQISFPISYIQWLGSIQYSMTRVYFTRATKSWRTAIIENSKTMQ